MSSIQGFPSGPSSSAGLRRSSSGLTGISVPAFRGRTTDMVRFSGPTRQKDASASPQSPGLFRKYAWPFTLVATGGALGLTGLVFSVTGIGFLGHLAGLGVMAIGLKQMFDVFRQAPQILEPRSVKAKFEKDDSLLSDDPKPLESRDSSQKPTRESASVRPAPTPMDDLLPEYPLHELREQVLPPYPEEVEEEPLRPHSSRISTERLNAPLPPLPAERLNAPLPPLPAERLNAPLPPVPVVAEKLSSSSASVPVSARRAAQPDVNRTQTHSLPPEDPSPETPAEFLPPYEMEDPLQKPPPPYSKRA